MATVDLGKVAFVWKGTYASGTTYESKDVVQYTDSGETSSYIYVNASSASGQTPSTSGTVNTTYWAKMAGGTSLSVGNNKIVTTDASGNVSSLALGSAGQQMQVNAGGTALEFATISSGVIKQKKYYYFTDKFNRGTDSWGDIGHPIGDGTMALTPTATGNIISIVWDFNIKGGSTWFYSSNRMLVSTDGGSSYGYVTNTSGGATHGQGLYLENSTALRSEHQEYYHLAGNTNEHKFKIQNFGRTGGGGINVNQDDHPGGTEVSRVILTEYDISNSGVTEGAL